MLGFFPRVYRGCKALLGLVRSAQENSRVDGCCPPGCVLLVNADVTRLLFLERGCECASADSAFGFVGQDLFNVFVDRE